MVEKFSSTVAYNSRVFKVLSFYFIYFFKERLPESSKGLTNRTIVATKLREWIRKLNFQKWSVQLRLPTD